MRVYDAVASVFVKGGTSTIFGLLGDVFLIGECTMTGMYSGLPFFRGIEMIEIDQNPSFSGTLLSSLDLRGNGNKNYFRLAEQLNTRNVTGGSL